MALEPNDAAILAKAVAEGMKSYNELGASTNGRKFVGLHDLVSGSDAKAFKESLKNLTHNVATAAAGSKSAFNDLVSAFKGGSVAMMDNTHDFEKLNQALKASQEKVKSLDSAVDAATITEEQGRQAELKRTRSTIMAIQVTQNLAAATAGVVNAYIDYNFALKTLSLDYQASIISGKSAQDTYTSTVKGGIDANSKLKSSLYNVGEQAGFAAAGLAMMLPGWGKLLSVLGVAVSAMFAWFDRTQKQDVELQKKNLDNQLAEYQKFVDNMQVIHNSGGVLARGMTEMGELGARSGYGVKIFSEGLKLSRDSIDKLGMSYDQSAQLLSRFGKTLHDNYVAGGNLAKQFEKMGIHGEHQIEIMAETAAKLKLSNDRRYTDDAFVLQQSVEYAKTLKMLNLIQGKNAKDSLKKAQQEALEVSLQAKYGGTKGATDKLTQQIQGAEAVGAGFKEMYVQFMSLGRFVGAANNLVATAIPQIRQELEFQQGLIKDTTMTADQQKLLLAESNERIKLAFQQYAQNNKVQIDAQAQAAQSSEVTKQMNDILSSVLKNSAWAWDGQAKAALKLAKEEATNKEILDKKSAQARINQDMLIAQTDKQMQSTITKFITQVADTAGGFNALIAAMETFRSTLGGRPKGTGAVINPNSPSAVKDTAPMNSRGRRAIGIADSVLGLLGKSGSTTTGNASGSTSTGSLSDIIAFGSNTGDEAHFRQADPALQGAFVAMAQEYYAQTKKKLHINSAFRNMQEQANVVSTSGMKAKPGHSLHERGQALDINSNEVAELSYMGLLGRYKFNTLAGDPMHIQMADKGAELRPGEMAVVGENGPEIVGGPGTVSSRSDTNKLFASINAHLSKLVKLADAQNNKTDKLIRVVA